MVQKHKLNKAKLRWEKIINNVAEEKLTPIDDVPHGPLPVEETLIRRCLYLRTEWWFFYKTRLNILHNFFFIAIKVYWFKGRINFRSCRNIKKKTSHTPSVVLRNTIYFIFIKISFYIIIINDMRLAHLNEHRKAKAL